MTKEEAIAMIENDKRIHHDFLSGKYRQALDMAIEALKERPKGEWMHQGRNKRYGMITTLVYYMPTCSECGKTGDDQYHYCPHCGADMKGGDDETD